MSNTATGKVLTGFSLPYVASYSASGTTVTYTSGRKLARGVSISIAPETSSDNTFYADNVAAESASGIFTGGTATVVVDGMLNASESLIFGLPAPETLTVGTSTVDVYTYGDSAEPPYVGLACIARYMSEGTESYVPILLTKCKFKPNTTEATTQEQEIGFQTQSLEATIFRDDSANHNWKKIAADQTTEAAAEAIIKAWLSIT